MNTRLQISGAATGGGGGGAAGLESTVVGALLWRCSSCVHAPALFGASLLGDVKRLWR